MPPPFSLHRLQLTMPHVLTIAVTPHLSILPA
jgi:hypothetical protein